MVKVNLFDKDIELDKTIYVSLDGSMDLFTMFPESMKDYCYAGDFKRLCQFIKEKRPCIITCITKCVDVQIMELGYEIIVQNGNKFIKFSELVNGDVEKSFGREIRQTHNWEKMLYGECFDLDVPDWR
ncbi:MAG: hypothetical protein ACI3T9_03815 [Romboutsia timonensis]